jgi:molybdopterin-guanine dinucleotide biosynthesis protein A
MAGGQDQITGILLAGGQGRRMGGVDKGLQLLRGKPMAQHVIERFAPQVDELLINANQNIEQYQGLGYRVIPDAIGGFVGPLAGLHRGLSEAAHPLVVTAPCDSPFLPLDLVAKLKAALDANNTELAVAKTGDQPHPVFSLCRTSVLPSLTAFLESGGRKIDLWYSQLKVVEVQFAEEAAFRNINTREELSRNEQI